MESLQKKVNNRMPLLFKNTEFLSNLIFLKISMVCACACAWQVDRGEEIFISKFKNINIETAAPVDLSYITTAQ